MTVLGFIAALVQALAWPLVVLVIVIVFHRQVKDLLSEQIKRFKAGPVEVEWERQVVRVETLIEHVPTQLGAGERSLVDELGVLALEQPGGVVLTAFDRIAERLRPLFADTDPEPEATSWSRLEVKLKAAAEHNRISHEVAKAIEGMHGLRGFVAHSGRGSQAITPERARQYLVLADAVIYSLAGEKKPGPA